MGPATRVRAYDDDVYFVLSNTMFYVDRLHKLVAAQCACSDLLGNANSLVLNMGARVSKITTTNNIFIPLCCGKKRMI